MLSHLSHSHLIICTTIISFIMVYTTKTRTACPTYHCMPFLAEPGEGGLFGRAKVVRGEVRVLSQWQTLMHFSRTFKLFSAEDDVGCHVTNVGC